MNQKEFLQKSIEGRADVIRQLRDSNKECQEMIGSLSRRMISNNAILNWLKKCQEKEIKELENI